MTVVKAWTGGLTSSDSTGWIHRIHGRSGNLPIRAVDEPADGRSRTSRGGVVFSFLTLLDLPRLGLQHVVQSDTPAHPAVTEGERSGPRSRSPAAPAPGSVPRCARHVRTAASTRA